jgi:membrane protein DedA with SNARE-associated domain
VKRLREILIAWGPWGVFFGTLIESSGVPSPGGGDFMLLAATIARPEAAWLCAALAIAGSLLGSAVFYEVVRRSGEQLFRRQTPRQLRLRAWFERYGLASVFVCALVPLPVMPLKVMALSACALGVRRWRFLGAMAAARIPRYGALAYLGATLGDGSNAWLRSHLWHMGAVAAGLLAGLYLLLRLAERRGVSSPRNNPTVSL